MAIVVNGVVGVASGTNVTSLTATLTAGVPAISPTASSVLLCFIHGIDLNERGTTAFGFFTDTAGTTNPLYCTPDNQYVFGPIALFAEFGGSPPTMNYALACEAVWVYRQMFAGDQITLGPFTHTCAYARMTILSVSGLAVPRENHAPPTGPDLCIVSPNFTVQETYFLGPDLNVTTTAGSGTSIGGSEAITAPSSLVLQMLLDIDVPSVSALAFNDGSVTTFDTWYDQGGAAHSSGILGYSIDPSGTFVTGGTSDQSAPAGQFALGSNQVLPGVDSHNTNGGDGSTCVCGFNPVFNNRVKIASVPVPPPIVATPYLDMEFSTV